MKNIFITGTDTGSGKTVVTGLLARFLLDNGLRVITQKWIETGSKGFSRDAGLHLKLMGRKKQEARDYLPYISPYTLKFSSSPHLAASLEGKTIDIRRIKRSFRLLSEKFDRVIVEGIGGALVPFNEKRLVIDIAGELNLPVLIVADNKLGAINHTLLTIEAIRRRKMKIIGIIFNNRSRPTQKTILRDNPRIIKILTKVEILGELPFVKDVRLLRKPFIPIGVKIVASLRKRLGK